MASMSVSSSQGLTSKRTEVLAITLGFFDFFFMISLESLFCDSLLFLVVLLIIRSKQVDFFIISTIILFTGCRSGSCFGTSASFETVDSFTKTNNKSLKIFGCLSQFPVFKLKLLKLGCKLLVLSHKFNCTKRILNVLSGFGDLLSYRSWNGFST